MQIALSAANCGALKATCMPACGYSTVGILSRVLAEGPVGCGSSRVGR